MSVGDIKNNISKLQAVLRKIHYPHDVDLDKLVMGETDVYLPIYHYIFLENNPEISQKLLSAGIELFGRTDLRFVENIYKALRDVFDYKPSLTKAQFLSKGFAERKVIMCVDIIGRLQLKAPRPISLRKSNDNASLSNQCSHPTHERQWAHPPVVMSHIQTTSKQEEAQPATLTPSIRIAQLPHVEVVNIPRVTAPSTVGEAINLVHIESYTESHVTQRERSPTSADSGCSTRPATPESICQCQCRELKARVTLLENQLAIMMAMTNAPPVGQTSASINEHSEQSIPERDVRPQTPSPIPRPIVEEPATQTLPPTDVIHKLPNGNSPDGSLLMTNISTPSRESAVDLPSYFSSANRERVRRINDLFVETKALLYNGDHVD